jgi:hypothetical protein
MAAFHLIIYGRFWVITEEVVHEFDVLATEWGEWFLVVAIFGTEFAINYGGPEIDGYLRWLEEHNYGSPLYSGRNAGPFS